MKSDYFSKLRMKVGRSTLTTQSLVTKRQKKELIYEHFYYEVNELRTSLVILLRFVGFNNICHDVFLLHARVLREFFFPSPSKARREDDSYADHFIEDWNLSLPKELSKIDERAGKEIMHLTYSRISGIPEHKRWDFIKIYEEIAHTTIKFISLLPSDYSSERTISIVRMLEDDLNKLSRVDIKAASSTTHAALDLSIMPG